MYNVSDDKSKMLGRVGYLVRIIEIRLHIVQTGYRVHPTSYPMGTGGSFSGGKEAGA
jgi:hypothetical protein